LGEWIEWLQSFSATLSEVRGAQFLGGGAAVLGSPLNALALLLEELDRYGGMPLRAHDIVTTGTLTAAPPAAPGDHWRSSLVGLPLGDIEMGFV
jgi:2-oxo-3-hexenedioate decarboxylase